ncbi:MAG: hypothetical protein ACR5LF_08005 [Symbiopectobacterium sp.]
MKKKNMSLSTPDGVPASTGWRAGLYLASIARDYQQTSTFVASCETNQMRMQYANKMIGEWGHTPVLCFSADQFETMYDRDIHRSYL